MGIRAPSQTAKLMFRLREPLIIHGDFPADWKRKRDAQLVDRMRQTHITMQRNYFYGQGGRDGSTTKGL